MSDKPLRNIRIVVEYDGTRYLGWQTQADGATIQGELSRALSAVTEEQPHIQAAGRTDAGVHAFAQVANFQVHSTIPAERFAAALNANLPGDIKVHTSGEVELAFNARHASLAKRYRYRVYNAPQPAALDVTRAWHVRFPLDVAAMRAAAEHLLGEQDFESFRSAQCDAEHARREMFSVTMTETDRPPVGRYVDIVFHANAFCRHMCRILAGTLIEVGLGRRTPADILRIRDARDRARAGITAPAAGLTLLHIEYPASSTGSPST